MQAAVQAGTRSQRALNGLVASPHAKPETVNAGQGKSRKRERTDQSVDSSKRERSMKLEDSVSNTAREGKIFTEEIASIASKGGDLSSIACVDQLVHVMRQEWQDRPVDVTSWRTSVASIIAVTEKEDCLTHFVQLGGLPVLDDWLQEAHKGKVGDGGSPVEGDKGLDELTLMLLRALEKLPIDLDALKTCVIGKSVNNLRTHKNVEVQKKARKLVELWKKRVDAEMKSSDEAKPGPNNAVSWSSKHPTLRSRNQPVKGNSVASSKDSQKEASAKHKRASDERVLADKETSDSIHDDNSNHQRIIVRLPNPGRSPNRGGAISKASSLSSTDKHDSAVDGKNTAIVHSPDSCGNIISGSRVDTHVDCEASLIEHKLKDANQSSASDKQKGSNGCTSAPIASPVSRIADVSQEGFGVDAVDGGVTLSASIATCPDPQTGKDSINTGKESKSLVESEEEEGETHTEDILKPDKLPVTPEGAVKASPSEKRFTEEQPCCSSAVNQISAEKAKFNTSEKGSKAKINTSEKGSIAFAVNETDEAKGSEGGTATTEKSGSPSPSAETINVATSMEECQIGVDSALDECSEDARKTGTSLSEDVAAQARDILPGYDEEDALDVARQVAIEVGQEVDGLTEENSSSHCKSETGSKAPVDESSNLSSSSITSLKTSEQETAPTDAVRLDSGAKEGDFGTDQNSRGHQNAVDIPSPPAEMADLTAGMVQTADAAVQGDATIAGNFIPRRLVFDLNDCLSAEEATHEPAVQSSTASANPTLPVSNMQTGATSSSLPAPIAVVTATKGPFIPSSDLLRGLGEVGGWKGSAATSAFRPAEPRHATETSQSVLDASNSRCKRPRVLDIDLNVADERGPEGIDVASTNFSVNCSNPAFRPDLDLNKSGDNEESTGPSSSEYCERALPITHVVRDFDLNDGLEVEGSMEQEQLQSHAITSFPTLSRHPTNSDSPGILGSASSGPGSILPFEAFPSGPAIAPPSHPLGPCSGSGAVLSSSGVPFTSTVPNVLPYAGFPFISGFPFTNATFNLTTMPNASPTAAPPFVAAPSQVASANAAAISPYARPYFLGSSELPGGTSNASWSRRGLDLNAGLAVDMDVREDGVGGVRVPPLNQLTYQQGGTLKRREPDPYFDPFRSGCRQMAWH